LITIADTILRLVA